MKHVKIAIPTTIPAMTPSLSSDVDPLDRWLLVSEPLVKMELLEDDVGEVVWRPTVPSPSTPACSSIGEHVALIDRV